MTNIQEKLGRIRPSRVNITYDIELNGAIEKKSLPFIIGIISDLSGNKEAIDGDVESKFINLDKENFPDVIKKISPTLNLIIDKYKNTEKREVLLNFNGIDDFLPKKIVSQVDFLKGSLATIKKLNNLYGKLETNKVFLNALQDELNIMTTSQNNDPDMIKNNINNGTANNDNNETIINNEGKNTNNNTNTTNNINNDNKNNLDNKDNINNGNNNNKTNKDNINTNGTSNNTESKDANKKQDEKPHFTSGTNNNTTGARK
jgi:type VI secretion system protein ImpB